jgi:hypothetical protein
MYLRHTMYVPEAYNVCMYVPEAYNVCMYLRHIMYVCMYLRHIMYVCMYLRHIMYVCTWGIIRAHELCIKMTYLCKSIISRYILRSDTSPIKTIRSFFISTFEWSIICASLPSEDYLHLVLNKNGCFTEGKVKI